VGLLHVFDFHDYEIKNKWFAFLRRILSLHTAVIAIVKPCCRALLYSHHFHFNLEEPQLYMFAFLNVIIGANKMMMM